MNNLQESREKLGALILYRLECEGFIKMQGDTLDDIQRSITESKKIISQMLTLGIPA